MTKVLLLLSALVMGAAGFLAYENGRTLKTVREEHIVLNRQVRTEKGGLETAVESVGKKNEEIVALQKDIDTEGEKLKQNKLKIAQTEADLKRVTDDTKDKSAKMQALAAKLNSLPPGYNPQTLPEQINKLKQEIAELQTQAEAKKGEVATAEKKVADSKKTLDDIVAKIETRKKSFERNTMTGKVVAVNSEWGFVVLDVGQKEGITPDTKLLVIRGTATVGKLSIIDVQGNRTVANILGDTLAIGMSPSPGDRVILENLYQ